MDQINNDSDINANINKWIDFIFGVNQYNNNVNSIETAYRKFSNEFYAQNSKFEKKISELKEKLDKKQIYNEIKSIIELPLNFGLCPIPILTEATPKKHLLSQYSQDNKDKIDEVQNVVNIENNSYSNKVEYFAKSRNNKNIIILYENGLIHILSPKKKNSNEYEILIEIKIKGLLCSNLIAKYTFCEIKEDIFIFCGFLDKTLKFYHKDKNKINYLLDMYTTSILSINEKDFITGHCNGKLIKWEFVAIDENNQINYEIKKILEIKSNKNTILCLEYENKLNVLLSCDSNSVIIRNYYNFEILKHIKIKEYENPINKIIKLKVFNCNLIYVLLMLNDNVSYELRCYSLNGTYYKKIKGYFMDFQLNKTGNIIINDLKNREIIFYKGCHLDKLFSKTFPFINSEKDIFLFEFENPNIIYFCHKERERYSIKKVIVDINNKKENKK